MRATLLPPRDVAPGFPAVLAPLEWTLCWFQDAEDDAEDWLERVLDPPLVGRDAGLLFPLEWLPPAEAAPGAAFMPL